MKTAFIIFNRMTALDFIGIYDPLTRINSMAIDHTFSWEICANEHSVHDDRGLKFIPKQCCESLEVFDLIIIPGGSGAVDLHTNTGFINWLQSTSESAIKASVCSGALLMASAGFLRNQTATTHPGVSTMLGSLGVKTVEDRIVDGGSVITAGVVTASIDLGLYLVEKFYGLDVKNTIAG